jgi:hypothetical protein
VYKTEKTTQKPRRIDAIDRPVPADASAEEAMRDVGDRAKHTRGMLIGFVTSAVSLVFAVRKVRKARATQDKLAVAEAAVGLAGVAIGIATRVRDARAAGQEQD